MHLNELHWLSERTGGALGQGGGEEKEGGKGGRREWEENKVTL